MAFNLQRVLETRKWALTTVHWLRDEHGVRAGEVGFEFAFVALFIFVLALEFVYLINPLVQKAIS